MVIRFSIWCYLQFRHKEEAVPEVLREITRRSRSYEEADFLPAAFGEFRNEAVMGTKATKYISDIAAVILEKRRFLPSRDVTEPQDGLQSSRHAGTYRDNLVFILPKETNIDW
jgi:hypothetical protein